MNHSVSFWHSISLCHYNLSFSCAFRSNVKPKFNQFKQLTQRSCSKSTHLSLGLWIMRLQHCKNHMITINNAKEGLAIKEINAHKIIFVKWMQPNKYIYQCDWRIGIGNLHLLNFSDSSKWNIAQAENMIWNVVRTLLFSSYHCHFYLSCWRSNFKLMH